MKISARNQFKGIISSIRNGSVNASVMVDIGGGDYLTAIVTMEGISELGIQDGMEVMAIVKAPWVMLMTDDAGLRLTARNILRGTVSVIEEGAVNSEVTLQLPGGSSVVSVVTREAVEELGLAVGVSASAVIKASSVILGVTI